MNPSSRWIAAAVAAFALLVSPACQQIETGKELQSDPALPPMNLNSLEKAIALREYEASRHGDELQAPNRAQNLRTYFGPTGIRVHDRTAEGNPELVSMELRAVGRGKSSTEVGAGEITSKGARVEIVRPGLIEWYENGPEGLEQGFTVESRSAGSGDLVLELEVSGAPASALGKEVVLTTQSGRKLSYGRLEVRDARDRILMARLEIAAPDRIRVRVDDSSAVYPIVIDPLLQSTPDGSLESDQADAGLGNSVASAGDVNGDGYVDVIVGARFYDAGEGNEGAAFVVLGSAAGIGLLHAGTDAARLESNQDSAWLGTSVASAGDVNGDGYADVIVGAPRYGASIGGAAFVFLGSASGIPSGNPTTAHAQLVSDLGSAEMGQSVASAGDVNGDGYADVIVGAQSYSTGAGAGAAFIFHGSASGIASGNPTNAATRLIDSSQISILGNSVASAGDVNGDGYSDVIVGAFFFTNGQNREGAAFVFRGSASGVPSGSPASADAQLESNSANTEFGYSVASAGDVNGDGYSDVVVGSRLYANQEGGAFVFLGSDTGIADANAGTAHARLGAAAGSQAGTGVGSGNVNGDGYSDVIVGAGAYSGGQINEGRVSVYVGSPSGFPPGSVGLQLERDQPSAQLGASVASADVNGDGFADVIAGANFAGDSNEGVAFVYLGSAPDDRDADRVPDATDNCPYYTNASQLDTDLDGRGDACECTDQTGDGRNNVADIVAINQAIFGVVPVSPLCDGNNDNHCNVSDIVATNTEIFSPTSTSTCAREPVLDP